MLQTQAVNVQPPCKLKPQSWFRSLFWFTRHFFLKWMDFPSWHGGSSREAVSDVTVCVCVRVCVPVHVCVCVPALHSWLLPRPRPWAMRSSHHVCCLTSHTITLHNPPIQCVQTTAVEEKVPVTSRLRRESARASTLTHKYMLRYSPSTWDMM